MLLSFSFTVVNLICWLSLACIFLVILVLKYFSLGRKTLPGPLGYPIFGNLLQLKKGGVRTLAQWTEQYGGIFRLVLGSREAVVLNTHAAIMQTIVQQGIAFQSRPEFNLWHKAFLKALDYNASSSLGTMKYSESVGRYRKLLAPELAAVKLPSYNQFFSYRYFRFMRILSDISSNGSPSDLGFCLWTTAVGITTDQLVGQSLDDDMIRAVTDTNIKAIQQRSLGAPLSDYVPLLAFVKRITQYIPSPFPSSFPPRLSSWLDYFSHVDSVESQAENLRRTEVNYCQLLSRELHQRLEQGDNTPSILGDLIRGLSEPLKFSEELVIMGSIAGTGVAIGTILMWLTGKLAMSPEIQDTAYDSLKAVYGDQFPDPLETDRVKYIQALVTEAGRFWPPFRLGIFFRETIKDSFVDGHIIPEGTLVIYNTFQINRDPQRYDFPDEFRPERWMGGNCGCVDPIKSELPKIAVPHLTHGAGRRICMGISNTNRIIYGALTLLLYFFKLERAPLSEADKSRVFPQFRGTKEASLDMHPFDDQVLAFGGQALPGYIGIKLVARDPEVLSHWLAAQKDMQS